MNLLFSIGKRYLKIAFSTSMTMGATNAFIYHGNAKIQNTFESWINEWESDQSISTKTIQDVKDFLHFYNIELFNTKENSSTQSDLWHHTGQGFVNGATFGLKLFASPLVFPLYYYDCLQKERNKKEK